MVEVDKHNLLAGVGPDDSDLWICIENPDDWRTCEYENYKKCPICGDNIK